MAKPEINDDAPVIIKKYANRRLYNTSTSTYVTLDHLCEMVKEDVDFVVYDAKSGEDITRAVLTQIIFEQEGKGNNLLPIGFLRQLIGFYDDSLRSVVPSYLELSLGSFVENQEKMREYVSQAYGDFAPIKQAQEWGRQNMAMFQQAMSVFQPFAAGANNNNGTDESGSGGNPKGHMAGAAAQSAGGEPAGISDLKAQLNEMQRQIDALTGQAGESPGTKKSDG